MSCRYVGGELQLFAAATNWKSYVAHKLGPLIGGRVLEIGAGLGANTSFLHNGRVREWICLEPDPELARQIRQKLAGNALPRSCRVVTGTIAAVDQDARFDAILYLDVLEHIADDRAELARASRLLSPNGKLVVLAPAHQCLFSPFDAAVGHCRRYNHVMLRALTPPGLDVAQSLMLDSAGFFASLANRLVLSAALPSRRQLAIWDKLLVPISRVLDRATAYRFGKTVVAVWRRSIPNSAELRLNGAPGARNRG